MNGKADPHDRSEWNRGRKHDAVAERNRRKLVQPGDDGVDRLRVEERVANVSACAGEKTSARRKSSTEKASLRCPFST